MKQFLMSFALSTLFALAALAAGVDGKWKMTFEAGGQTRENTLTLKADGAKLTGKLESQRGNADIQDGKIDGDAISFVVVRNFNGNEVRQQYKGKVKGDEIQLTATFGDQEREMTAKRIQ